MAKETIIKARQKRNDGEVIQERKIAADNEKNLKRHEQHTRDVARQSGPKREPRHDEFNEMVPCRFKFEQPMRRKMQITADRARNRLRLVVIIEARKITPARVAAQFDQAGANHDAKPEPAKKPEDQDGRPALWKRPSIEQWTKKDREKASLEQLNLPAVTVPDLPDVNDRHVHRPKNAEDDRICVPGKNNKRKREPRPGEDHHTVIGNAEPKETGHSQHAGSA